MPGLLRGMARTAVIAGTATHVSNNVSRRQARKWNNEAQEQQQQQEEQIAPTQSSDPMEQLQKLGELHAQGILTDEEFASKKQELLNQM
jgi:hypothetical protein